MLSHKRPGATSPHAALSTQQERSSATLERILAAAEELLETREFSELTMADLARSAGCAVGTVYGRIPNKQSLLLCLHERHISAGLGDAARVFERCGDAELEQRVRALASLLVDFLACRRGVTRAFTNHLFARAAKDEDGTVARLRRDATVAFRQAATFLAAKVDTRIHADPQTASEFALLAAHDVAQSRVVFGKRSGLGIRYSMKALKARIAALLTAYLQHGQEAPPSTACPLDSRL